MGLQSQLNDVSSESIPILLVAIIANCVNYLHSLIFSFFQSDPFDPDEVHDPGCLLGSGLAGFIFLSEQLNLNRVFSYRFDGGEGSTGSECVVCLNRLTEGDHVRKLACCHVFHKECFDGWLHHHNFNCPLCRSPLVSEERVVFTERRVTGDLLAWFSFR